MAKRIIPQDFYVYFHRKSTTGSVFYIGKGHGKRAWQLNGRNSHWKNIVKKHGLTVEIGQDGLQEWFAFELECDLIALYGRPNLCNLTDGGEGAAGSQWSQENRRNRERLDVKQRHRDGCSRGQKGKVLSDDHKKKLSQVKTGKKLSKIQTEAMSKCRVGVPWSKKQRDAILKAKSNPEIIKKQIQATKLANSKRVICLDTNQIFSSTYEAGKLFRPDRPKSGGAAIGMCCCGKLKTAYGYTWRYA